MCVNMYTHVRKHVYTCADDCIHLCVHFISSLTLQDPHPNLLPLPPAHQHELGSVGPHICAVPPHVDGHVSDHSNAFPVGIRVDCLPLPLEQKLLRHKVVDLRKRSEGGRGDVRSVWGSCRVQNPWAWSPT